MHFPPKAKFPENEITKFLNFFLMHANPLTHPQYTESMSVHLSHPQALVSQSVLESNLTQVQFFNHKLYHHFKTDLEPQIEPAFQQSQ